MTFEFKFKLIESGTIYLIPRFVRCIHCNHEIHIGEFIDNDELGIGDIFVDKGGCGKSSRISDYAKCFGVIKNIG